MMCLKNARYDAIAIGVECVSVWVPIIDTPHGAWDSCICGLPGQPGATDVLPQLQLQFIGPFINLFIGVFFGDAISLLKFAR